MASAATHGKLLPHSLVCRNHQWRMWCRSQTTEWCAEVCCTKTPSCKQLYSQIQPAHMSTRLERPLSLDQSYQPSPHQWRNIKLWVSCNMWGCAVGPLLSSSSRCCIRPVAAQGCLPPGANVGVATPTNQISSSISIFQDIGNAV